MRVNCDKNGIKIAIDYIANGKVLVFPTDTVYGIGCNPYDIEAVNRIYKIKKRMSNKQLPLLACSKKDVLKIAHLDEKSQKIADTFWPGPVTLILKLDDIQIKNALGLKDKVAIRVPDKKCTINILEQSRLLVGTSANMTNSSSFSDPDKCYNNFKGFDLFVDGGILDNRGESTIVECIKDEIKIHRQGVILQEEIMKIF